MADTFSRGYLHQIVTLVAYSRAGHANDRLDLFLIFFRIYRAVLAMEQLLFEFVVLEDAESTANFIGDFEFFDKCLVLADLVFNFHSRILKACYLFVFLEGLG